MNVNGREFVKLSRESAVALLERLTTEAADPSAVGAVVYEASRWLPADFIERDALLEHFRNAAPVMTDDELAAWEKCARKAYRRGKRDRVGYLVDADALATQAEVDERLHSLRVQDAAREMRAAEKVGDLPSLWSQVLAWDDLAAQPEARWTVDGVIPERATVIVYGASGVGKSFVCQSIAASIAGGFDWLGRTVERGAVLYVFAEGGSGAGKRFQALSDAWHKGKPIKALRVLPVAPNLTLETDIAELEALNREHDFAAIVYDTLNRVAGDAEENSATAMSGILNAIERVRRAGSRTTSVIVHHSGKNGDQRGSTALWAAADTILELTGEPGYLKLDARKQKDAPEGIVGHYRLAPARNHDTLIVEGVAPGQGQPSGAQATRIEEALAHFVRAFSETGSTVTQFVDLLVEAGTAKKSAAHAYVNELVKTGRLKKTTAGRGSRLELVERTTLPLDDHMTDKKKEK